MPLKNGELPPHCTNHRDEEMVEAKSTENESIVHIFTEARLAYPHTSKTGKATAVRLYVCPICGYCEAYGVAEEIEFSKKLREKRKGLNTNS